jgi:hypothetical protein
MRLGLGCLIYVEAESHIRKSCHWHDLTALHAWKLQEICDIWDVYLVQVAQFLFYRKILEGLGEGSKLIFLKENGSDRTLEAKGEILWKIRQNKISPSYLRPRCGPILFILLKPNVTGLQEIPMNDQRVWCHLQGEKAIPEVAVFDHLDEKRIFQSIDRLDAQTDDSLIADHVLLQVFLAPIVFLGLNNEEFRLAGTWVHFLQTNLILEGASLVANSYGIKHDHPYSRTWLPLGGIIPLLRWEHCASGTIIADKVRDRVPQTNSGCQCLGLVTDSHQIFLDIVAIDSLWQCL